MYLILTVLVRHSRPASQEDPTLLPPVVPPPPSQTLGMMCERIHWMGAGQKEDLHRRLSEFPLHIRLQVQFTASCHLT
jgi:hypothetical protein